MKNSTKRLLSFALAGTIMTGVPVVAHASDNNTDEVVLEETLNTTNYVVKDGDTLGKIAEKFYGNSGYWEELAEYNHMDLPCLIYPGQIITIPEKLTRTYNYVNNTVTVEQAVYPEDTTYTVKEGDTMYCIVRVLYGLTNQEAVDKLATYNNLSDPNRISRGQVLLIPCKDKLLQVVQNDYTAEYNRMGWILNHPKGCKPCNPCDVVYIPVCPPQPCQPQPCPPQPCPPQPCQPQPGNGPC